MLPSVKFQNLGDRQINIPFTFGHVFKPGDLHPSEGLRDLQVDVKALHTDGSVRHAVCSGMLAGLDAGETFEMPLLRTFAPAPGIAHAGMPAPVVARLVLGGMAYSATASAGKFIQEWLSGPVVSELHTVTPFVTDAGVPHPHLTARFAIRMYDDGPARVEVVIENCWAYEPNPQNFKYAVALFVGDDMVFSKAEVTHFHHARWRHVAWTTGADPQINIQLDTAYLIASGAIPNYDTSFPPSPAILAAFGVRAANARNEVMGVGLATPYMPTTGGRGDIGILPDWATAYALSMDTRARDATLVTGDAAGSWSSHYRDRNTDRPVSLKRFPYMTIAGRSTDTFNPATRQFEAFPGIDGAANPTPYTHDSSHQPNLAYLPYLVTGDYYYLEELQFWAMWNVLQSNPGYRDNVKGLVRSDQTRGQAWTMRTLAEAAYITPDADSLKADLVGFLNNNLDWFNSTYTNNATANKLGAIVNGYAIAYGTTGIAPWQDDFFTAAIGHAADLGFEAARPLLAWKAKYPVDRMVAPGVCWIDGAVYSMNVRATENAPFYASMTEAYAANHSPEIVAMGCNSPQMAASINLKVGEMTGYAASNVGYPSNMQPALAYAVDAGTPGAAQAWRVFMARTVKPDYTTGSQFSIVPRPQITEEPKMTYRVSVLLALAAQTLPITADAAPAYTRVEIREADGVTVVDRADTAPYEFTGVKPGDYVLYAVGVDSKGDEMGEAYTQKFTVSADAPTTREVQLPSGATITFTQE